MIRTSMIAIALACLAACGESAVDDATETPAGTTLPADFTAKPQGPVTIDYRIIGTPIVGQPLAVDIEVTSLVGDQSLTLNYRISDTTSLELGESQPADVSLIPSPDGKPSIQQVRLVPLREGRLFLNVAASVAIDGGTVSTAIAIPIQVGSASREPEQNGTITTDEQGEAIHSLPAQ